MNLLFVTPSDKIGGGNRVMFELAARLSRRHRVTCAFPRSPGLPKYRIASGIRTVGAGLGSNRRLSILPNLLALYHWLSANKSRFDAVVSTGQVTGIILPLIKHRNLFNYIQADEFAIFKQGHLQHSYFLNNIYSRLMFRSLRSPGINYLFNSKFTHSLFSSVGRKIPVPFYLILPGVDASVFKPFTAPKNGTHLNVTSVARHHSWKGLDVLLKAHEYLPQRIRSRIRWHLISNDDLSGFRIPEAFAIHRPQSDAELVGLLQQTDIFLSTSLWEGFGLPALEAMACGCGVITSRNGGCDEYAVHNRNCLVYPPRDHALLAEHIRALVRDGSLRARLSGNGLRTARRFTWKASAVRLEAALAGAA